jgi:hypothetical protein
MAGPLGNEGLQLNIDNEITHSRTFLVIAAKLGIFDEATMFLTEKLIIFDYLRLFLSSRLM